MASDRGKKIDTWEFKINLVKVSVAVKMRTDSQSKASTFFVLNSDYDLDDRDSDINALKKRVESHLRSFLKVEWERFFLITVCGDVPEDAGDEPDIFDDGEEMEKPLSIDVETEFDVKEIEIGTKPDGSKCWRACSLHGGVNSKDGLPETGSDSDSGWQQGPRMSSLVVASPENRAAVEGLRDAFLTLNQKLQAFLAPDVVAANLIRSTPTLIIGGQPQC